MTRSLVILGGVPFLQYLIQDRRAVEARKRPRINYKNTVLCRKSSMSSVCEDTSLAYGIRNSQNILSVMAQELRQYRFYRSFVLFLCLRCFIFQTPGNRLCYLLSFVQIADSNLTIELATAVEDKTIIVLAFASVRLWILSRKCIMVLSTVVRNLRSRLLSENILE